MIVGSTKEDLTLEKRVSLTPETAKNIIGLGLQVYIEKDYASHLGIQDNEYQKVGVEIKASQNEVLNSSKAIIKVNCPSLEHLIIVGSDRDGWESFERLCLNFPENVNRSLFPTTMASDLMLIYFTSGTTAAPTACSSGPTTSTPSGTSTRLGTLVPTTRRTCRASPKATSTGSTLASR